MRDMPLISIVTPTFNQGEYIEETISSVIKQNYPNLEYIIIDGGSTDNTLEIIKKYEQHVKFWISEKDNGQAHAINKGLSHCSGDIFNWLNSDDYLEPGALWSIADAFKGGVDAVAGEVRLFEQDETIELVQHKKLSSKGLMYWEEGVKFVQPGVWLKREKILNCGGIDEKLHYCFDWDLYIRYLDLFPSVKYLDKLLIHFRYHDLSKTVSMQQKFKEEEHQIVEKLAKQRHRLQLSKIASIKVASNKWMPFLLKVVNSKNEKVNKIFQILVNIRREGLMLWRPTLGAIKMIVKGNHY